MRLKNIAIKDAIRHPFFIWMMVGFAKRIETCLKGNVKGGGDARWQSGRKIRRKPEAVLQTSKDKEQRKRKQERMSSIPRARKRKSINRKTRSHPASFSYALAIQL
jgi:hypothetical protein